MDMIGTRGGLAAGSRLHRQRVGSLTSPSSCCDAAAHNIAQPIPAHVF